MITFELTEQEVNLILRGLGELPAKFSLELIGKLQNQAKNQMETKNEGGK